MELAYRRKGAWGKTDEQDRKGNLHGANSFTPAGGMPARLPNDLANEPDHSNRELITYHYSSRAGHEVHCIE